MKRLPATLLLNCTVRKNYANVEGRLLLKEGLSREVTLYLSQHSLDQSVGEYLLTSRFSILLPSKFKKNNPLSTLSCYYVENSTIVFILNEISGRWLSELS